MQLKRNAFAVFDCENEGWTDESALVPVLLHSGQQRQFAFYVYDKTTCRGFVSVSETPQKAANDICVRNCIVPTSFVVLTIAINIEQVEMLDHELDDLDLDHGVEQEITPDEFIKNMTRMFGSMIMTVNSLRDGAPSNAMVTYSCDGGQCSAEINGKPDVTTFGDSVDVCGVKKEHFLEHVKKYFEDDDADGPICSSDNQMFVKITNNKPDEDFSDSTTTELISEIVKLKFASHVEQENQAINNHQALMAFGVVMEGSLEEAISDGRILSHFDPTKTQRKYSTGRVMGGTLNIDAVMRRPSVHLPVLCTPNYVVERFNAEFPGEEPLSIEEVEETMDWLGMRGYYDFYPDDPHIVTAATSQIQAVIFIRRVGEGKYSDCGIGFFLTPIGINEVVKGIVKMRFYRESRHAVEEVTNSVQKNAELGVLIDRYTDVFGDAVGEFLVEVTKFAMGNEEFGNFMPKNVVSSGKEPKEDEPEVELYSETDFCDITCVSSTPK